MKLIKDIKAYPTQHDWAGALPTEDSFACIENFGRCADFASV